MTFGFIGTGNMGGALAKGVVKAVGPEKVFLSNRSMDKAQALAKALGCQAVSGAEAARCDFLFLGVKPHQIVELLKNLAPIPENTVLVSMAAGVKMAEIQAAAGGNPVIRIMPNTPVAVGEGVVLYDATDDAAPQALEQFQTAMAQCGLLDRLPEGLIDAGSALSGCGPAFACLFLEALADGGVACGLPRQKALLYAAQTVRGTARLLLETGEHPGKLKDQVCSPGGSTVQGVRALEQGGLRSAAIEAVIAAFEKTKELGK